MFSFEQKLQHKDDQINKKIHHFILKNYAGIKKPQKFAILLKALIRLEVLNSDFNRVHCWQFLTNDLGYIGSRSGLQSQLTNADFDRFMLSDIEKVCSKIQEECDL